MQNVLSKKFPELKDFPEAQEISIFEVSSLIGENDVFKEEKYTSTLRCTSKHGTLFAMNKDQFFKLKKSQKSWDNVKQMVAYRQFRQLANQDDGKKERDLLSQR